jgi:hypothetical protein
LLFLILRPEKNTKNDTQFILFDVDHNYTKADTNKLYPNKSNFYVQDSLINLERPVNWESPSNYRNGHVHFIIELKGKSQDKHLQHRYRATYPIKA